MYSTQIKFHTRNEQIASTIVFMQNIATFLRVLFLYGYAAVNHYNLPICYLFLFDEEQISYHYSFYSCCSADRIQQSSRLRRFKSDRDESFL